jgi:hypothetical protein
MTFSKVLISYDDEIDGARVVGLGVSISMYPTDGGSC